MLRKALARGFSPSLVLLSPLPRPPPSLVSPCCLVPPRPLVASSCSSIGSWLTWARAFRRPQPKLSGIAAHQHR